MFKVVVPRVLHIVVRKHPINPLHRGTCDSRSQFSERVLTVERSVDAACRAESRELRPNNIVLFGPRNHVAVRSLVERHGWIDIEAIDGSFSIRSECLTRHFPTGLTNSSRKINRASRTTTRTVSERAGFPVLTA